jgi:hypothetical protein
MKIIFLALLTLGSVQAAGWQYADFIEADGSTFSVVTSKITTNADSMSHLLQKLGCKGSSYIDLFDCLGAKGWELVTYYNSGSRGSIFFQDWIFKKPK